MRKVESQNNYLSKREVYKEDKALTQELLECLKITTYQRERFINFTRIRFYRKKWVSK